MPISRYEADPLSAELPLVTLTARPCHPVFTKLQPGETRKNHSDRAVAHFFIRNTELWEKSNAVRVAKLGTKPPLPKENMPGKK